MIRKSFTLLISISLISLLFLLFYDNHAFPSDRKLEKPILCDTDLPGFCFYGCTSSIVTWGPWSTDQIEGLKKDNYIPDTFESIEESWFSVPPEILNKAYNQKPSERPGYYAVSVKRYILPSSKEALNWLKIAFEVNYFTVASGNLFEERSFTGKKIGDNRFIFREDKAVIASYTSDGSVIPIDPQKAWEGLLKSSNKMLYFTQNSTAVCLSVHYVEGKDGTKEIPATWIDNLAETICSRL